MSTKKSSGKKSPPAAIKVKAKVMGKAKGKAKAPPTTIASILGRPMTKAGSTMGRNGAKVGKIKTEWQRYYDTPLDLRDRLLAQMNGLAKESAEEMSSYSLHMADSGTDNFDRDFALSLLSSDQDAIYEIEEALKRIESFGN